MDTDLTTTEAALAQIDQLRLMLDAASKLQSTTDINEILRQLVRSALAITDSSSGTWAIVVEGKMVVTEYVRPGSISRFDYEFERGQGIPGWILVNKRFYLSNDAARDPQIVKKLREEFSVFNLLTIPIIGRQGQLLGCFELHNKKHGGFHESDVEKLDGLVYLAVLAIENAMLLKSHAQAQAAIQRRFAFEKLIAETSTELINVSIEKLDRAMERALGAIAEFFNVDRGYVFLYSPDMSRTSNTHEWVRPGVEPCKDQLQNLDTSSMPWIRSRLTQGLTVLVEDVEHVGPEAKTEQAEWQREHVKSVALVPMASRGHIIGFIGLDSVFTRMDMTQEYVSLLRTVGEIFANALDRKRAEEKLLNSEKLLLGVLDSLPVGIWLIDASGQIVSANPKARQIWGGARFVGPEEFGAYRGWNASTKELLKPEQWAASRALKEGIPIINEEIFIQTFDGKCKTILNSAIPIRHAGNGNVTGAVIVNLDITDRKSAEELVKQSEAMLRLVLDTIPVRVFWKDKESKYLGCNRLVAQDSGLESSEDIVGKTDYDFSWKPQADLYRQDDRKVIDSGQPKLDYEEKLTTLDGRSLWIRTSKVPLKNTNGEIIGVLGVWQDITVLKETSEKLAVINKELAAKNKELESIIYVASHDLRSPLVNIQGFGNELRLGCESVFRELENKDLISGLDPEVIATLRQYIPQSLDFITSSVSKMDRLISGLLSITRASRAPGRTETVDVNAVISRIIKELGPVIRPKNAHIEMTSLPTCRANPGDVYQVFANLLSNAVTYLDPSRPGLIRVTGQALDNQSTYCIEDNGIGIPQANLENIFEIFYRLDPDKTAGEGLGLTLAKRILDRYNGSIRVESQVGKGSRFFITLPGK